MITWIAFAKTMCSWSNVDVPFSTEPEYALRAAEMAGIMAGKPVETLMDMLKVSDKIAMRTAAQFQEIVSGEAEQIPALAAYTGVVFKRIAPLSFSHDDWRFAQDHLRIVSSLYGLLRPLDRISAYRLEALASPDGKGSVAAGWRSLLTDNLISLVRESGGVLLDLASEEMKLFVDWDRVASSVRVVKPDFYERRNGSLKSVTMYAKMCRGEMVRYVVDNRIDNVDDVSGFSWEGFVYDVQASSENHLVFVRG